MPRVTYEDVLDARERIRPHVHRTPTMTSARVNALAGCEIYFKCENFQKVGAFKARGACNAVFSLSDTKAARGVVTHSSGNHGAALAWAASKRGIKATVVVPENAPLLKKRAIDGYGATIVYCAPTVEARTTTTDQLIAEHGYTLVHPYDDDRVIAGQATAAYELLEDAPTLDMVIAPTGGGGLLSGTGLVANNGFSRFEALDVAEVHGAEPRGARDAHDSFHSSQLVTEQTPSTICDGLRTTLSSRTLKYLLDYVTEIHLTEEATIIRAMRMIWESMKIIVEPSSCPPLAAILEQPDLFRGKKVGIILTGGNVDLEKLPWQS